MTIIAYRDAVIEAIKTAMPVFREVASHGGTFTEAQLKRYALKCPACRVAFIGVKKNALISTGESKGPARFAAYILAEDRKGVESFDVAIDLAEQVASVIQGNAFGSTKGGMAMVEGIENLFTLGSDKTGITIAAVSFEAEIRFGVNTYLIDDPPPPFPGNLSDVELDILGLGGGSE